MKKRNLIFLILAVLLLAGCSGLQGSRTAAAAAFLQRLAPEAEITEVGTQGWFPLSENRFTDCDTKRKTPRVDR